MNIISILYHICIIVLLVYILFGLFLFFAQKSIIYFPDSQDMTSCSQFTEYEYVKHNETRMLFKEGSSDLVIIFYHGNFGSVCDRNYVKIHLEKTNHSILFPEYTGFSNDSKKPNKKDILQNVKDVNSFIKTKDFKNSTLIGESLGSGPASYHTTLANITTIILISPFSSIVDVGKERYWFYPLQLLVTENFDNTKWLKNYKNKIFIFHGKNDTDVPQKLSQKLFDSVQTTHKKYYTYDNLGHNDLWESKEFIDDFQKSISN